MNTYLAQVLDCFARMDIEGLRVLLKDEYIYYDVPKDTFLERLGKYFELYLSDEAGNYRLDVYPGACCNRNCDPHLCRTGFRFVGVAGFYLDLRFILEKDENGLEDIKDIYPCNDFLTNKRVKNLQLQLHFWVYEDDKVTFKKDNNHLILVKSATMGYSEWVETFEHQIITVSDIQVWLEKYKSTYERIGGFKLVPYTVWKWNEFLRLFYFLDKLFHFLEDFEKDIEKFKRLGNEQLSELKLVEWIVNIERRIENNRYWELYGSMYRIDYATPERKIKIHHTLSYELDENFREPGETFLTWFEAERRKLVIHYFSLTYAEFDEFMENNTDPEVEFRLKNLLSFHLDSREKFRQQGVYIPYNLGQRFMGPLFGGEL